MNFSILSEGGRDRNVVGVLKRPNTLVAMITNKPQPGLQQGQGQ